jgi:Fic family protein
VHITYSPHEPPSPGRIEGLMGEYFVTLHREWPVWDALTLASYGLWRLAWIHPFEDANGRVARAVAFLIICLKYKRWIPGGPAFIHAIKQNATSYTDALRVADIAAANGKIDVSDLALLLGTLIRRQLIDAAAP